MSITLNTVLILFTLTLLGFASKALFSVANSAKELGYQMAKVESKFSEILRDIADGKLEIEKLRASVGDMYEDLDTTMNWLAKNSKFEKRARRKGN